MATVLRIAVVRSLDGHTTICGPNDHSDGYSSPMDAALSWHIEAGHMPAECLWAEIDLPPVPDVATLRGLAQRGEFPKNWVDELDADAAEQVSA
jgi:hypothetical protein